MSKFWFLVFLVQIGMVLTFIFPDDDYFEQRKPIRTPPRYQNKFRPQHLIPHRTNQINNMDDIIKAHIFDSCKASCPATIEYDPVCGTNRVTYDNKSKLVCERRCGVDVRMGRPGRCKSVISF